LIGSLAIEDRERERDRTRMREIERETGGKEKKEK